MATSPEQGIGSGAGTGDGVTDVLPGFDRRSIPVGDGVVISVRTAGRGPAVLLMHGYPQTSSTWHAIAPRLAERFTVVAPDLRGYGDSSRPASDESHAAYSKRRMALDQVEVMRQLGHPRFAVVGHDRGGRVAHRMARDHAGAVERVAILDIAPTATMYARTDREFASRYFWWFFLIQPNGLPERLIGHDVEFFLREQLRAQSQTPGVPGEELVREYLRCMRIEGGVRAVCEDFRAAAGIDLEHDTVEDAAGSKLAMPLLVLWGARGAAGKLYDVLGVWREKADDVTGGPLDCGHILQEEVPGPLLENSWRSSAPFDVPPASRQRASRATAGASYPRRLSSLSTLRSPMRRRSCYEMSSAKRLSLRALSLAPRAFHSVCRSNWKSSWK